MLLWPATHSASYVGKREYQQDRHIALPDFKPRHGGEDQVNCCLVGVFDGHKSEQAAELAAAKMPGIIADRKHFFHTHDISLLQPLLVLIYSCIHKLFACRVGVIALCRLSLGWPTWLKQ